MSEPFCLFLLKIKRKTGLVIMPFMVFCLAWFVTTAARAEEAGSPLTLTWSPQQPKQGDIIHLVFKAADKAVLKEATIKSKSIPLFSLPDHPGEWHALLGVDPSRHLPGDYEVKAKLVSTSDSDRVEMAKIASLNILPRKFPEEHLTLPSKVQLSNEDLARVRKDNIEISSLWSKVLPERLWQGSFIMPVEGRPGSAFGVRRWINGEPRNFHTGMDIKVPEGTPIKSSNNGRVALVGDYFFSGLSVFIDHGQGLYTMYFHFSEIKVKVDEKVSKGDVLGLAGMTGRASGPHLHWGVRLGGARVNPEALIDITENIL